MRMHRAAVPARARRGLLRPLPAMDLPFLILVLTLVGFGLVMLYSASSAVALYRRGDAWAYVRPQLLYAAMGIGAMWAASRVDYHIYHKLAWPLLALSLVLLVVVLFMPEYNGCKRWLVLPGLGTLQPSEIAKFAVVLVFAHIISLNHSRMESFAVGVVPFALVLGAVAVLMLLEPHLSGTVLILGIGAVLMFVGGTGLRWFVLAGVGGAGAIGAAIVIMPDLVPYAASRLSSWLDPFADPLGDGHQTIQSLYAIGSSGAAGLGLGSSRAMARQIVNHGHITVNGHVVDIPSYLVKAGDVVAVKSNKQDTAIVGAMSVSPTRRRVAPCRIPQPMKSRGT